MHRSSNGKLFDPQKLFSTVQAWKKVPKSSGDYASVSSDLSYTHSVMLFSFTLPSSTADGSSTPLSPFDYKTRDEFKTNVFSTQLKKLYHDISLLELRVLADLGKPHNERHIAMEGCPSIGIE